jgi:hypothetical protein
LIPECLTAILESRTLTLCRSKAENFSPDRTLDCVAELLAAKKINNFDFCICILLNLCYGVYIPVGETADPANSELEVVCVTGLPARAENVRAVFFCQGRRLLSARPPAYTNFPLYTSWMQRFRLYRAGLFSLRG